MSECPNCCPCCLIADEAQRSADIAMARAFRAEEGWALDRRRADAAESVIADAMSVLNPSMPESGLVDACRQRQQAYITERDNARVLEEQCARLRERVAELEGKT